VGAIGEFEEAIRLDRNYPFAFESVGTILAIGPFPSPWSR
jgi:hypothetical protein